jgi:hypothetical protein
METQRSFAADEVEASRQLEVYEGLLASTAENTRTSYGAGLLRFHQYCDRHDVSEHRRMPASPILISAFIADALGSCSGKCIRNWLNGLQLWHLFNRAEWCGADKWVLSLKKSGDRRGAAFKRPLRGPVTEAHMLALRSFLDLDSGEGAAKWAAATAAFWGCRRLGELLPKSAKSFDIEHDTCRCTRSSRSRTSCGRDVVGYHIVWTKTTTFLGGECVLTATLDPLCPVWAHDNHTRINHSPPPLTPIYAYRSGESWRVLTKDIFLHSAAVAYKRAGLAHVFGHSYRIGGSVKLLLDGVEPEVIMKLGGWTSLCFLIYWRRLELVLSSRIAKAWDSRIRDFALAHGHAYDSDLSFDRDA